MTKLKYIVVWSMKGDQIAVKSGSENMSDIQSGYDVFNHVLFINSLDVHYILYVSKNITICGRRVCKAEPVSPILYHGKGSCSADCKIQTSQQ